MPGLNRKQERNIEMKRMLSTACAAVLAALAGCAKEDYSDPEAFAEKYFREAIEKRFPVETAMNPMRFKGVKLLNIKRELVESFGGTIDRVTCDFEPIPESGVKYYARRIGDSGKAKIDFSDEKIASFKRVNFDILSDDERIGMERKMQNLRDSRPDLVEEVAPNGGRIIAYRAKNDKGVFEPVKMGSNLIRFEGGLSDPHYCFTEDRLAGMHVLIIGSKEADAAIEAHRARCVEVNRLAEELNVLRVKLGEFTGEKQKEIRLAKEVFSNKEYDRNNKRRRLQQMKERQEKSLVKLKNAEQQAAPQRGRQRRVQKAVDTTSIETRIREMGAEIESLNAQSAKDKSEMDTRVAFLESLIAYERGETDKVAPTEGASNEEKALCAEPAISTEILPKLQRLKALLECDTKPNSLK